MILGDILQLIMIECPLTISSSSSKPNSLDVQQIDELTIIVNPDAQLISRSMKSCN